MEKNLSTEPRDLTFFISDYQLLLKTGDSLESFYKAAKNHSTHAKAIHWLPQTAKGQPLAAAITAYEELDLAERIHDQFFERLPLFLKRTGKDPLFIHFHCPNPGQPQAILLNSKYFSLLCKERYPKAKICVTTGSFLQGLLTLSQHLPEHCHEWLSIIMDCQTDERSLKLRYRYEEQSKNDPASIAGEAYVFLQLSRHQQGQARVFITAAPSSAFETEKQLQALVAKNQILPENFIYPRVHNMAELQWLIIRQRALWSAGKEKPRPAQWLSPYFGCGDSGAATEALCLLLAFANARNQPNHPPNFVMTATGPSAVLQLL